MKKIFHISLGFLFLFSMACREKEKSAEIGMDDYKRMGDSIVRLTFDSLRSALTRTIRDSGLTVAISYCNQRASGLTQAYASIEMEVRRTSFRYRNPDNAPDSLEKAVLKRMELAMNSPQTEIVLTNDNQVHYFKPILTQALCLNCHGDPESQILPEVREKIKEYYPSDLATSFKEGELRGAWHIRFEQGDKGSLN